ncbi:GGDEF domain-containing protein [Desulfopila aestuarii]|uniref:diguanylate cyclase n=1 Tax=Desulfopila aestuarii DSM 18488 TaxID=1121416 RepID=A0A1M7Y660_9BACT|nr:GGDEF domain-containing protein [Desulfopila aestuarii]SHO47885.1 diguanylate cyclase (GGDEF) domain-containing protein [Desulfopila aestuarii DSM 18488]
MSHTLAEQVREFLAATRSSYSYNPFHNIYIWFGILWGLPIPLASTLFQALFIDSRDITLITQTVIATPIQWIFLAHPFIFGCLFGILGTVRHHKDEEVQKLIEELKMMSILDPLTGLSNRRYFTDEFEDELARIERKNTPLALIFLDLDHFKNVNDTHGHRIGDEILRLTASHLRTNCRPYDIPARWGGEEFIILLPDTTEKTAATFAERIRQDFTRKISPTMPITVTVSIGVTAFKPGDTLEYFVDRADKALYHAKRTGRNKVVSWSDIALGTESDHLDQA